MSLKLFTPTNWPDYELLDSGGFEKLERFGKYILIRPEPQAVWNKSLSETEWEKQSNARFRKEKGNPEKGEWVLKKGMPQQWYIDYSYEKMALKMRLGLTSFRHIGIFPEQSDNWNFIYNATNKNPLPGKKVLNLFAYTGGASLAARAGGAEVVHVDSVKPVVTWARENMEASVLKDIRWVVEDAMKFVQREVRRGNIYQGIIMDPPAYGRGPDGEKWLLEEDINEMTDLCSQLLAKKDSFLVMNLYSMGFSALILENLVGSYFENFKTQEIGELYLPDSFGKRLPLGVVLRREM
ncbi:MAG: class I SAM-dependent methyltransferase [Bacteroidota bacterium]